MPRLILSLLCLALFTTTSYAVTASSVDEIINYVDIDKSVVTEKEYPVLRDFILQEEYDRSKIPEARRLYFASLLLMSYITDMPEDDESYNPVYQKAEIISYEHKGAPYDSCYGEDQDANLAKKNKIHQIKQEYWKGREERGLKLFDTSPFTINSLERQKNVCRHGNVSHVLASLHLRRGDRAGYNRTMIEMIKDDQVGYDYLYEGKSSVDRGFIFDLTLFLSSRNKHEDVVNFTKGDVLTLYKAFTSKYDIVFRLDDKGLHQLYHEPDGIEMNVFNSLLRLTHWLDYYDLDNEREEFIHHFFNASMPRRYLDIFSKFETYKDDIPQIKEILNE